jgi:hypothetical protein
VTEKHAFGEEFAPVAFFEFLFVDAQEMFLGAVAVVDAEVGQLAEAFFESHGWFLSVSR